MLLKREMFLVCLSISPSGKTFACFYLLHYLTLLWLHSVSFWEALRAETQSWAFCDVTTLQAPFPLPRAACSVHSETYWRHSETFCSNAREWQQKAQREVFWGWEGRMLGARLLKQVEKVKLLRWVSHNNILSVFFILVVPRRLRRCLLGHFEQYFQAMITNLQSNSVTLLLLLLSTLNELRLVSVEL